MVTATVRMTLNYLIDSSRDKFGDRPALGMALGKPLSYNILHDRIITLAMILQQDGVQKGDHVAILAENSHYWGVVYFAAVRIGAVVVPILPDLPEADVHHILDEMKVQILFTTRQQIDKVFEYKQGKLPKIITLDDDIGVPGVLATSTFTDYLAQATTDDKTTEGERETLALETVDEDDLASIIYTSGTSGHSKAVMLSHKNLIANVYSAAGLLKIEPGSVFLSILPLSHSYEFTCGFLLPLLKGCRIAYASKTPTPVVLQELCKKEKPFAIFAVPMILEKIYKKRILPRINEGGMSSLICKSRIGRRFLYKKLGNELMQFFGGRLEMMGIGGDCLNAEVEQFLLEAGFPYIVGYGLTETAPLISGGPVGDKTISMGSCGKPIMNVNVKIVDQDPKTGIGEIFVCGPNVMKGYYDDDQTTAAVLSKDGWLATGDLGLIDEDGNLHVYGRVENLISMDDGTVICPERIEQKVNSYHWVVESLIVKKSNSLDAWVYLDYEFIDEKTKGISQSSRNDYIGLLFHQIQDEINEQLPSTSRLTKVFERREPFMKTTTQKIKRYLYDSQTVPDYP